MYVRALGMQLDSEHLLLNKISLTRPGAMVWTNQKVIKEVLGSW